MVLKFYKWSAKECKKRVVKCKKRPIHLNTKKQLQSCCLFDFLLNFLRLNVPCKETAIDVTTLEPYKSCGQLANKAQGSALGSLVSNQNVVLPLLQQNKKDSNKCHYPFYMGRSGLEPPTSPLSGVRSNHLS